MRSEIQGLIEKCRQKNSQGKIYDPQSAGQRSSLSIRLNDDSGSKRRSKLKCRTTYQKKGQKHAYWGINIYEIKKNVDRRDVFR